MFSSVAIAADEYEAALDGDGEQSWSAFSGDCTVTYNAGADRYDGCFGWDIGENTRSAATTVAFIGRRITRVRVEFEFQQTRTQGGGGTAYSRIVVGEVEAGEPWSGGASFPGQVASYAMPSGLVTDAGVMDSGEIDVIGNTINIGVVVRSTAGNPGYARITKIEVWTSDLEPFSEANWTRPLAEEDEHAQWEMFDYTYVNSLDEDYELDSDIVFAFSEQYGAPVFAATDGTVIAVEPWTVDDCQNVEGNIQGLATAYVFGANCYIVVPVPINNDFQHYVFKVNPVGLYRVDIQVAEKTVLRYIVTNAAEYITVGDVIQQGCILGLTSQLLNVTQVAIDSIAIAFSEVGGVGFGTEIEWQTLITQFGVVTMALAEISDSPLVPPEPIRVYPSLTQYAQFDQACNVDPAYSSCLGDPTLARPNEWSTTGNVAWLQPGAQIGPSAQIRVTMNLDPEVEYSLTVVAARTGPLPAAIRLQIGVTIETSTVLSPPGEFVVYTIASGIHESNVGGFWTVAVINSGQEYLEIRSVCVTEGDPSFAPTSCYFNNFSFDFGGSGWTLSSNVQALPGGILVPDGETFSQNLHLFPDDVDPVDYTIRIETYLAGNSFFDPNDPMGSAGDVDITYDWDATSNEPINGTVTFEDYRANANQYTFTDVITVSSETNDPIIFYVSIDSADTNVLGLIILSVCISGPFHDDNPNQAGPGFEFEEHCQVITPPVGNNIGPWISWHWAKLNKFFQCDLMVLLNRLYRMFVEFFRTITWTIRYWIALAKMSVGWLGSDLLPWLAGYLSNAAGGTTIINAGGQQCEWWNLLCHLISALELIADVIGQIITEIIGPVVDLVIWMIQRAFDLLITALTGLLVIGFQLIGQILGLLGIAQQLLASLADAYSNATPVTIDGLPMCTGAQTNDLWCAAMWTLENTIFAGLGALLIPLIVSIGAIHLIIWVIRQIKEAFMTAGAAI